MISCLCCLLGSFHQNDRFKDIGLASDEFLNRVRAPSVVVESK